MIWPWISVRLVCRKRNRKKTGGSVRVSPGFPLCQTSEEINPTLQKENQRKLSMKRILTRILMAAGIAGPFVAHVAAQDHRMIANIPFTFIANERTMPAGQYQLTQRSSSGSAFQLRNATGRAIFVLLGTREGGKPNRPSITFACHGKQCVLAKVAPPGSSTEYSSARDSVERNLQRMASMVSIKLAAH